MIKTTISEWTRWAMWSTLCEIAIVLEALHIMINMSNVQYVRVNGENWAEWMSANRWQASVHETCICKDCQSMYRVKVKIKIIRTVCHNFTWVLDLVIVTMLFSYIMQNASLRIQFVKHMHTKRTRCEYSSSQQLGCIIGVCTYVTNSVRKTQENPSATKIQYSLLLCLVIHALSWCC
jgi:hypothetical protein